MTLLWTEESGEQKDVARTLLGREFSAVTEYTGVGAGFAYSIWRFEVGEGALRPEFAAVTVLSGQQRPDNRD